MNIDITNLYLYNVIDSCSVWNIISCPKIYNASLEAGCYYAFTYYVEYECLHKKRNKPKALRLITKLKEEMKGERFMRCNLTIDDLQEIELLENRKRLGLGELSSIALSKKTRQAFLTDDKEARKLGESVLGRQYVQTTPHIVGFFFYKRYLLDSDLAIILEQHKASLATNWGDLSEFFEDVYQESMRRRLIDYRQ